MNNFFILKSTPSFLVFILLHQIAIVVSNPAYNATDLILLDCGSTRDNSVAPDARSWSADLRSKFGPVNEADKSRVAEADEQGSSAWAVPYMTARISRSQFTYSFPVTSGPKFIRLHFRPTQYEGGFDKYKDWIDVRAGPYTLLRNFSASLHSDDLGEETFFREFCLNVEEEQRLNITFAPFTSDSNDSYVFINGIEIASMPSNLYYTPPDDQGIKFIGQSRTFKVQNDTALGMVYRLNVGGSFISPTNDTGMYRSWSDDYEYIRRYSFSVVYSNPNASLSYLKVKQYIAPDDVYRSERWMGARRTNNLTWGVPVHPGYTYLVRLHFCEVDPDVTPNYRRFDVFIDNQTAEVGLDVMESSGGSFIPIFKDYMVMAGKKGETEDYMLYITLRPNPSSENLDGFLNGMEVLRLNDSTGNLAGPNKESTLSPEPAVTPFQPLPAINKSTSRKTLVIAVGGAVVGFFIILSVCGVLVWRLEKRKQYARYYQVLACCGRLNSQKRQSSRTKASSLPQELCRHFSLGEIKAATNNFDQRLIVGEGGFGHVYKGDIDEGTTTVAIKRLNQKSKQGAREFKTEIEMLSQLRHVHLVSLIGYCNDEREMVLVYDYMVNGTVREHLYDTNSNPLPWKQRLEICVGAARGLDYLHTGAANTIIHRDIKTSNILLDENWVAKVADFGLSKIGVNNTAISTVVKGTWGYLDPEYARLNHLTEKSDVYSFGVVLFEVLCGRKPLNQKLEDEQMNLAHWARKCIENGTIHQIIDPYLMGKISPDCFNKFVDIAESCIRDNGIDRPSMHDVKEQLEFALKLQQAADADQEGINTGVEFVYPEVSFCAPRYTHVAVGSEFNPSNASAMDISSTGFSSVESGTITFSHTANSSTT